MGKYENLLDFMAEYLTYEDIITARANAKITALIIKARCNAKLTKKEFAKIMGVSTSTITKWESAEYDFSISQMANIFRHLPKTELEKQ